LGESGCPVGGRSKPLVPLAASAAFGNNEFRVIKGQVNNGLKSVCIGNQGTGRKIQVFMISIFAVLLFAKSGTAILGMEQFLAAIFIECPLSRVHPKNYIAAITAVTAVRAAKLDVPFPAETGASRPTITRSDGNNCFIYKFHAS
jgi:hypothetical protein